MNRKEKKQKINKKKNRNKLSSSFTVLTIGRVRDKADHWIKYKVIVRT